MNGMPHITQHTQDLTSHTYLRVMRMKRKMMSMLLQRDITTVTDGDQKTHSISKTTDGDEGGGHIRDIPSASESGVELGFIAD
ncbi:hypothetical protein K1719_017183 [Acacia pycnantha]|nr:hypothetical protein K1719_017183 [Acacia pycnantha]